MSIQSNIARLVIRASGFKHRLGSKEGMRRYISKYRPRQENSPPDKFEKHYRVEKYQLAGLPVYHIQPRHQVPQKHVVFVHGGAYVGRIVLLHWNFLYRLLQQYPCQVTVPLYGLAPEYTFRDAFPLLTTLYQRLLKNHSPGEIFFMGDSSGGGLSLAFAQSLLQSDLPQPGGVVLLSPWLDITMSDPDVVQREKQDPLLAIPGGREAATMWSGGADPREPMLSPINGSVKGLAPLCLLTGSDDMLLPDARKLRNKAQTQGQPLCYLEYPEMFHAWMLVGWLPEAKRAMRDIVAFLEAPPNKRSEPAAKHVYAKS